MSILNAKGAALRRFPRLVALVALLSFPAACAGPAGVYSRPAPYDWQAAAARDQAFIDSPPSSTIHTYHTPERMVTCHTTKAFSTCF